MPSAYAGLARHWCPRAHVVYSVADLHHVRMARQAQVQALPHLLARARAVKQAELLAMRLVDAVITHSTAEAAYLRAQAPGTRVHVVRLADRGRRRNGSSHGEAAVAFIGSVAHEPNRDAVLWLIEEIMPRVWQRDPAITCQIVGADWSDFLTGTFDRRIWLVGRCRISHGARSSPSHRRPVALRRGPQGQSAGELGGRRALRDDVRSPPRDCPSRPRCARLVADSPDGIAELICLLHADAEANIEAAQAGLGLLANNFTADDVRRDFSAALARTGVRVERRSARA